MSEPAATHPRTGTATAVGILSALYAATFFCGALLHLGVRIPLGFAVLAEPNILPATIVEGLCGLALAVGAFAVLTRMSWAWTAAFAAHAFALGGVLLGMVALAVGAGPSTELNTIYHRVVLVSLVAVLALLLTPTGRAALLRGSGLTARRSVMKGAKVYEMRPFGREPAFFRRRVAVLAIGSGLLSFFGLAVLTSFQFFPLFPLFWVLPFLVMRALGMASARSRTLPPGERPAMPGEDRKEKELLEALERRGEITAARAALETSLSVAAADESLSRLAENGHVRVHAREGSLAYSLWDVDRREVEPNGLPIPVSARRGDIEESDS